MSDQMHEKRAQFAAFKKVMSLVFKYFLASFPLFFIFSNALLSRLHPNHSVLSCASGTAPSVYDNLSTTKPQ